MRKFIYRHLSKRWRKHVAHILGVPSGGRFCVRMCGQKVLLRDPAGSSILKDLYCNDFESSEFEQEARPLFKKLFSKENFIFFDIGAHVGFYTYFAKAVNPLCKVYAFEPAPANFLYLKKIAQENDFRSVVLENMAVSNKVGTSSLFIPEDPFSYSAIASLKNRFENTDGIFQERKCREADVQTTSLDEYVIRKNIAAVHLIKIDAEEAELEVLQGAASVLSRLKPDVICEILIRTKNKQEIFAALLGMGYKAFLITGAGLVAEEKFPLTLPKPDQSNRTLWKNHFFTTRHFQEVKVLSLSCYGQFIG